MLRQALAALFLHAAASAHDPGLSSARLRVEKNAIVLVAMFNQQDVKDLQQNVAQGYALTIDGAKATVAAFDWRSVAPNDIEVTLRYACVDPHRIQFAVPLLEQLPRGHRQHLPLVDPAGRPLVEALLDRGHAQIELDLTKASPSGRFTAFLWLGVEHILTGYDHILFLLALLIVGARFAATLAIITAFTLSHSLTLALAALDVVQIPSTIVEPVIAASIVYVALENLLTRQHERRWMLTFGFGLVHGFGFASVLRELGIGRGVDAAVPLVAFNLGVELGQLAIACMMLPLIWRLAKRPWHAARVVPVCSVVIAALGAWWLVERTLL